MIKAIFAISSDGGFAYKGKLPWNDPDDLAYFKKVTTGHVIVMGSSTFDSIGRELPNRVNVVITSKEADYPNKVNGDVPEILMNLQEQYPDKDIFVIGGKSVLLQARSVIQEIYLNTIKGKHTSNVFLDGHAYLGDNPLNSNIRFKLKHIENSPTNIKSIYERV